MANAANAALQTLSHVIRRALHAPHTACELDRAELACVRAAYGGSEIAEIAGFVERPREADGELTLIRPGITTTEEGALLRAIGLTLARAVPTPTELARAGAPRVRPPLLRKPPSFAGLPSEPVRLETDEALRLERATLEREAAEATDWPQAAGEAGLRPELSLL